MLEYVSYNKFKKGSGLRFKFVQTLNIGWWSKSVDGHMEELNFISGMLYYCTL
jgi:hypothetical protein